MSADDLIYAVDSVILAMDDFEAFVVALRLEIKRCERELAGMRRLEEAFGC